MLRRFIQLVSAAAVAACLFTSSSTRLQGQCGLAAVVAMQGNANSGNASLSADGRYLAFDSNASNLVANDTNGVPDVFVYDRVACTLERVSVNSLQAAGNGASIFPTISDDGRYVAFQSLASNLDGPPDLDLFYDVYLRDRDTDQTTRLSVSSSGTQGDNHSSFASISGDGTTVAFVSQATNLAAGDTNLETDIYVREGTATTRVSVATGGGQGESPFNTGVNGWYPRLSTDGRHVAFGSSQDNLVAGDGNGFSDAFLHDRDTGVTTRVSLTNTGGVPNGSSHNPAVSGNGRFVAFQSGADNLIGAGNDTNFFEDVFVRDTMLNTTTRVSVVNQGGQTDAGSTYPVISTDGRYVAFLGQSSLFVAGDTNLRTDIFVHDRQTTITRRASTSAGGVQADQDASFVDISGNGQFVAFQSFATTLVATNPPGTNWEDVFLVAWSSLSAPPNVDLMRNGGFASGTTWWSTFATPDMSYIQSNVSGGVFQYYRVAPPPGTVNQALVFQETTAQLQANSNIQVTALIGNADGVRKRITILVHDSDFSDLHVCTFWLPPNAPLSAFQMNTHTTKAWSNLTVSFYAASPNAAGNTTGFYRLDNVTVQYIPTGPTNTTLCQDPFKPTPPGGTNVPDIISNGSFSSGLPPWTTFGQIAAQVTGGALAFHKLPGSPAGVVFQATGVPMAANQILTADFTLTNASAVRKRVTVIMHDNDFSDLAACTFWLLPNQSAVFYRMRMYVSDPWTNATLSFYPATPDAFPSPVLDNVLMRGDPLVALIGTECTDNLAGDVQSADWTRRRQVLLPAVADADANDDRAGAALVTAADGSEWLATGFTTTADAEWTAGAGTSTRVFERQEPVDLSAAAAASFSFGSWYTGRPGHALVQVAAGDGPWETVSAVAPSDGWLPLEVDLSAYRGSQVRVRLLLTAAEGSAGVDAGASWRVRDLELTIVTSPPAAERRSRQPSSRGLR